VIRLGLRNPRKKERPRNLRVVSSRNRGTQHLELARVSHPGSFQAEPRKMMWQGKMMWQFRHIVTSYTHTHTHTHTHKLSHHLYIYIYILQEKRHIFRSATKNVFKTWQCHIEPGMRSFVTKMWRQSFLVNFVPVTHSKPGRGSGNISARNDPESRYCEEELQSRDFLHPLPEPKQDTLYLTNPHLIPPTPTPHSHLDFGY